MQKLSLKDFEFHIGSNIWSTAQDLAHSGAVRSLGEVEKNFWVAKVADAEYLFETEVIITPGKIKAYACECWPEQRRFMCAHIAASLLKVRQFLEQKAEEKAKKEALKEPKEISRIQVRDILKDAEPEVLSDFVQMYARRDRDFALALKTWFAATITGTENPYLLILDATIPKYAGTKKLSEPDYRRLRRYCVDLEEQVKQAKDQGNLRLQYLIQSAILVKLAPLADMQEEVRKSAISKDLRAYLDNLQALYESALASPELKVSIWELLLDLWMRQQYPLALEREALRFLSQNAVEQRAFDQISTLFFAADAAVPEHLLLLYVAALAAKGMGNGVVHVLRQYFEGSKPDVRQTPRKVLVTLYYLQYDQAVIAVAEHLLSAADLTAGNRKEIEDLLLQAAQKTNNTELQRKWLRLRYQQYGTSDLLRQLKTLAGDDWDNEMHQLLEILQKAQLTNRITALLAEEGQFQVLEVYLADSEQIEPVLQYADRLSPSFVKQYYIETLSKHLDAHYGLPGIQYVQAALTALSKKIEKQLPSQIALALELRYPDREGLAAELRSISHPKVKSWS